MSGYWRGRGRANGPSRGYHVQRTTISSTPSPPLGMLIESLGKDDLEKDAKEYLDKASIQDCELVASYNWLDKSDPTMIMPGKPPRWTPLDGENALKRDKGDYYRDKNASKYPAHLMESTVLAALSMCPDLPAYLDVVACYSSLGNLVRFCLDKDKSFRILVEVIGNAVFFVRRENSPTEKIEDIKGYGNTFPEAYTSWDWEMTGSDTSHRILKYRFGGLRMLVRAEADAYVSDKADGTVSTGSSRSAEKKTSSSTDVADITNLMSALKSPTKSSSSSSTSTSATKITLTTLPLPHTPIPQSQILEIKTRGDWKKDKEDTVAEEMPKLWLARVRNFVVAYHYQGTFEADIEVKDVGPRVDRWEKLAKRELAALAALMHRVIALVRQEKGGRVELCRVGMGDLEVREVGEEVGGLVSEEMKGRWVAGEEEMVARDEGVGLDVGDDGGWEDEKDWTHCSDECQYCGRCKKQGV